MKQKPPRYVVESDGEAQGTSVYAVVDQLYGPPVEELMPHSAAVALARKLNEEELRRIGAFEPAG